MVERSQGWMARSRRLARNYEQLAETLKGLHVVAFFMLMLRQLTETHTSKCITRSYGFKTFSYISITILQFFLLLNKLFALQ